MRFNVTYTIPSRYMFTDGRVMKILKQEMTNSVWLDPMAGYNSPAQVCNDLDPNTPAQYHEDALLFLKRQPDEYYDGVIFDPPYTPKQSREYYAERIPPKSFYKYLIDCKREIARIIKPGGKYIQFWYTVMGLWGYKTTRVVLICQLAPGRPDIICVVQRKVQTRLK